MAVAALTVAFDVVTAWLGFNLGRLGAVPVSPTLPIELCSWRWWGGDGSASTAPTSPRGTSSSLIARRRAAVRRVPVLGHIGGFAEAMGLVLAALDEEIVYRLAVLILVGAVVAKLSGRNWRNAEDWGVGPGLVAILASGLVFTVLPGHVAQMSDTLHALPFVCLGMVLGYAMLRTGRAAARGRRARAAQPRDHRRVRGRDLGRAAHRRWPPTALVALVLGTVVAGRRLGIFRLVPVVERVPAEA